MQDFSKLLPILTQSKIQRDNPALYQVITALLIGAQDLSKLVSSGDSSTTGGSTQSRTFTLDNSQILTLPTGQIVLVGAANANSRIKLLANPTIRLTNTFGTYGNVNATYATLQIQYDAGAWAVNPIVNDSTSTPALTDVTTFFTTISVDESWIVDMSVPYSASVPTATTGWIQNFISAAAQGIDTQGLGKSLVLSMDNNGSGNLTGGNSANSMRVTVYYTIEKLL